MFFLNWRITLVVVVLTPLSLFAAKFIASRTYNLFQEQSQTRGEQTAFLNEMMDGQKVVQAFGYEARSEARFGTLNERLRKASLRATFFSSLTNPVTRFVTERGLRLRGSGRGTVRCGRDDHGWRTDGVSQLREPVREAVQ